MEQLNKFYDSTDFKELDNDVKAGEQILIVGEQNTKTENFYYALWLKYYNKIEIYKYLYMNQKSKTNIRGKTNVDRTGLSNSEALKLLKLDLNGFKQIVFILEKNLNTASVYIDRLRERHTYFVKTFNNVPFLNSIPEKLISIENSFFNISLSHNSDGDILIFDTETNGLPIVKDFRCVKYDYIPDRDDFMNDISLKSGQKLFDVKPYAHARLLSIGWVILDRKTLEIKSQSYYLVKDSNIKNSVNAQLINKISDEDREINGVGFVEIYSRLKADLNNCGYIVTHGTDFDINVLCNEIKEHELSFDILKNKCICNTKQNLYRKFNECLSDVVKISDVEEVHNALYDAKLCAALFKIRLNH